MRAKHLIFSVTREIFRVVVEIAANTRITGKYNFESGRDPKATTEDRLSPTTASARIFLALSLDNDATMKMADENNPDNAQELGLIEAATKTPSGIKVVIQASAKPLFNLLGRREIANVVNKT